MKCPYCGHPESKVIDSRPVTDGSSIRRRRECLDCAKRFNTYEVVESVEIIVVKKDGAKELFDRADFVKFAKYVASDEDNAAALPVAVRFVTEHIRLRLRQIVLKMEGMSDVL